MSINTQLANAYYKFLNGIDWSDELVVAGSREGRNKFLSNAYLSMFPGCHKYHRTHLISETAHRQLATKNHTDLICEHLVPKAHYIQRPCEELAARGELTSEFIKEILDRLWRLATITKAEDAKLRRSTMPDDWDGTNVLARYKAAGI